METCAKLGVPVMMEKPLAVSADDAYAIAKAAKEGKITVLVNYETSWYPSNHEAYDLVRSGRAGRYPKSGGARWALGSEGNQRRSRSFCPG